MLNILSFFESEVASVVLAFRIIFAIIALACAVFITTVVMMQKGNTDGMEAMTGSSKSDDNESFYGKNASSRRDARLKLWTYICAGVLALCCILMLVLNLV